MIRIELSLRLANSPGALAGVCRLLSDERVNVQAMALETGGQLRLVVDNHVHAAAVLREHHHQVTERDVIVTAVPERARRAGAGAEAGRRRRRQRRVRYGGGSEGSPTATIVLGVETRERAVGGRGRLMKLYVETMDAVVVDVDADGRVRLEDEDWSQPTLQERRAIIHAAQEELPRSGNCSRSSRRRR